MLLLTNLAAAAVYGSLALALLAGRLTVVHLVIAGFLSGAADAFAAPATSATIRTIVPATQLPLAYTRLEARSRAVRLVGPPAGGALYSLARGVPFVVDAVSYTAEAFAVTRLRTPLPAPARERRSIRADIGEGLRFVWAHVGVRAMMIWGGLINLAGGFVFVAITLRLIQAGTRPAAIGLVETAAAAAGLVGALAAPMIISRAPTGLMTIVLTLGTAGLVRAARVDDERHRDRRIVRRQHIPDAGQQRWHLGLHGLGRARTPCRAASTPRPDSWPTASSPLRPGSRRGWRWRGWAAGRSCSARR